MTSSFVWLKKPEIWEMRVDRKKVGSTLNNKDYALVSISFARIKYPDENQLRGEGFVLVYQFRL